MCERVASPEAQPLDFLRGGEGLVLLTLVFLKFSFCFVFFFHLHDLRVSDQKGISGLYITVEMYHFGRKPSILWLFHIILSISVWSVGL